VSFFNKFIDCHLNLYIDDYEEKKILLVCILDWLKW